MEDDFTLFSLPLTFAQFISSSFLYSYEYYVRYRFLNFTEGNHSWQQSSLSYKLDSVKRYEFGFAKRYDFAMQKL